MSQKLRQPEAPRSASASARRRSKRVVSTSRISSENGNAQTMCPSAMDQKPSFRPNSARRKMNSAAPIDMPGMNSGSIASSTTPPGRAMRGMARPTRVAVTAVIAPTANAISRLIRNGATQAVSRNSAT